MNLDDLRKLEFASIPGQALPDDALVEAIVKVRRPGYVPPGLTLRSRVDQQVFTATFPGKLLAALNDDPNVASVALAKALRSPAPRDPDPKTNPQG